MCRQNSFLALTLLFVLSTMCSASSSSRPTLVLQIGNPFEAASQSWAVHVLLLAVSESNGIEIWDTRTWELERTFSFRQYDPHAEPTSVLALSPNGKILAAVPATANSAANSEIDLWDTASGRLIRVIHASATRLLFTPDGSEIAESGLKSAEDWRSEQTSFWSVQTGKRRLSLAVGGDLALSRDGQRLAVIGYANRPGLSYATLWNARTGRSLGSLSDSSGVLGPMSFSPDGKKIVTVGEDPNWKPPSGPQFGQASYAHNLTLKIWDVRTHKRLRILPGQGNQFTQGLQWSSDGKQIVSSSRTVLVYSAAGTLKRRITDFGWDSLLSADGETLMAAENLGVASLALRTGTRRFTAHRFFEAGYVETAAYSPNGSLLATSGGGDDVRLWDTLSGKESRTLPASNLTQFFFLPSGQSLVTTTLQQIQIWNCRTGAVEQTFPKIMAGFNPLLSPNGKLLLRKSSEASEPFAKTADVLDAATGQKLATLSSMEQPIYTARISPDSALLADGNGIGIGQSLSADPPKVTVWNLHSGHVLYNFPIKSSSPGPLAFSPDSKTLAVVDDSEQEKDGRPSEFVSNMFLYDMTTGQKKLTINIELREFSGVIYSPAGLIFSPDSKRLVISYDGKVKCFDAQDGKLLFILSRPQENLTGLAFSPDGTQIVTMAHGGSVHSSNLVQVWRVRDRRLLVTLIGLVVNDNPLRDWLAWTPEGYYAASSSARQAIRFQAGNQLLRADQCSQMYQPNLIRAAFHNK
jgi:WD40 repeat protein